MRDYFKRLTAILLLICLLPINFAWAEEEEIVEEELLDDSEILDINFDDPEEAADAEEYGFYIDDKTSEALDDIDAEIDTSIEPGTLELNPNLPDDVINILLVGVDTRSKDMKSGMQHGDVQIICSINKKTGSIKLTSILRDTYLTIPGYRNKARINVAYARGGAQLAMRTINHNFEMNIQNYVAINFYGLASIIDSIGGVDIEMTKQEAAAINAYIRKHPPVYDNSTTKRVPLEKKNGILHCDGIQAVMYARLRSIDNDFKRTERQRKLIEILLRSVAQDLDMEKALTLIETSLEYAETNFTPTELLQLVFTVMNTGLLNSLLASGDGLLEQHRVPMDKTYSYKTVDGNSVISMSTKKFKQNVEAVHEFIYGQYYSAK